jgi:hypothetical protein
LVYDTTKFSFTHCISYGLFCVQRVEASGDFSFCWYWWNCLPSLFKLSFHNNVSALFSKSIKIVLYIQGVWHSQNMALIMVHSRAFQMNTWQTSLRQHPWSTTSGYAGQLCGLVLLNHHQYPGYKCLLVKSYTKIFNYIMINQIYKVKTCIKRSPMGKRKSGLLRQVTLKEVQFIWNFLWLDMQNGDLLLYKQLLNRGDRMGKFDCIHKCFPVYDGN